MQCLLKIYLLLGRQVLQIFLYPVVSYYWLSSSVARHASREYLKRLGEFLPEYAAQDNAYQSYQHFISFANAIIDKLAALSGALTLSDVENHGREAVIAQLQSGQGLLLLGSHLGNIEVLRAVAGMRKNIRITILVHTRHAEKFNALLNRHVSTQHISLMQVTEINVTTAMLLKDKIDAGELVVIAADRTPVNGLQRVSRAVFLGHPAPFPQGPFILASLLKCPVYTLFCLKQGDKQVIYFDHFCDRVNLPRQQRDSSLQGYVQAYAERLQHYCLQAPLQWFNFYDFWQLSHD